LKRRDRIKNEGDIEESQVSMIIDEDVDSDSQYEMENEKDLSDSEIESDLEEDIVFLDLKKKSTTRIVVWSYYLNLCELQIENK
jgi:hypothetical protein